jgi:hypothetical protein
MSQITPLASGQLTATDTITVELGERTEKPALVKIAWPLHPTMVDTGDFPNVAAAIAQLFARAHVVLAAIKAERRL